MNPDGQVAYQGLSGRHRGRPSVPPAVTLALSVTALIGALAVGTALVPTGFTGSGAPPETPEAAVAPYGPGAGGGAPGDDATRPAGPPASPSSRPPSPARTATPGAGPGRSATARPRATQTVRPRVETKAAPSGLSGPETEVIRLVNAERGKAGCDPVRADAKLRTAIRLHLAELGTHGNLYISHVSDDGRTFDERARAQGYADPGGENVARGQRDAAAVMDSWMNSAGHRANILNCGFRAIGAGAVRAKDGTIVWGQLFGRS